MPSVADSALLFTPHMLLVLFKLREESSEEKAQKMMDALAAFQNQLPKLIQSMHSGVDKSAQTKGFSYCMYCLSLFFL
jgi:hypothetical protein